MEGKALVKPETLSVEPVDAQTEGNSQDKTDGKTILSRTRRQTTTPRPSTHEPSRPLRILCQVYHGAVRAAMLTAAV
jgi:hypothetical protein